MALKNYFSAEKLKQLTFYSLLAEAFFIALSPLAAVAALIAGIVLLFFRARNDKLFQFRRTPLDMPIVLFMAISLLSVFVSPDVGFSAYNYCNSAVLYLLSYILAVQAVDDDEQLKLLVAAFAVSAAVVVLYGYYQCIFGIDTSAMKWVDGDAFPELKKRVFSTWENPNILAGYLDEAICVAFAFLVLADSKKERLLAGVGMLLLLICLGMTYARGACLSLAVVLVGYGIFKDWRVLIGCLLVGIAAFAVDPALAERISSVFTRIDTSSEMRLALWESTVAMIEEHPVLGIGWGAYWMVYHSYDFYINDPTVLIVHAHNIYLNCAAEIGIAGALAYFVFFFGTLYFALQIYCRGKAVFRKKLCLGIALAVISVALGGMTDDVLFNIPTSMLLWLLSGAVMTVVRLEDTLL